MWLDKNEEYFCKYWQKVLQSKISLIWMLPLMRAHFNSRGTKIHLKENWHEEFRSENIEHKWQHKYIFWNVSHSIEAIEYTHCISVEGKDPHPNKYLRYDTKQSDGQAPIMLELWRMQITSWCNGCPRGVMVKAMNCGIVVREFVLQSRYYVHFRANTLGKGMNPLILPPAMGK